MKKIFVLVVEAEESDNLPLVQNLKGLKDIQASLVMDSDGAWQSNGHYNLAIYNSKELACSKTLENISFALRLISSAKEEISPHNEEASGEFNLTVNINTKERSLSINSNIIENWHGFWREKVIALKKLI